jgi:membrane-associated phospholipid phosphatase
VDTFFVRLGDVSKALVFLGVSLCSWAARAQAPEAESSATPSAQAPAPAPAAPPPSTSPGAQPGAEAQPGTSPGQLDAERRGYEFEPDVSCPYCQTSPAFPHGHTGLHWHDHWRSVGLPEYVSIAVLGTTALALQFVPADKSPSWDSPILFDAAARNVLRLHSPSARKSAENVSDVLAVVEIAFPVLVDPLLMAWAVRGSPSVAWQMSVINAQAYALTLALSEATKRLTSRARPYVAGCEKDPSGAHCGSASSYLSFYSGHAAVSATGAGLICAHHTQLGLYQNPTLDLGTCVAAVIGTAATGMMRIASDNHWASDVLVGHLIGYLSGYLLPTLLYYKEFRVSPHHDEPAAPTVAALPIIGDHSLQLSLFGAF